MSEDQGSWVKRNFRMDNVLALVGIFGAIAAGLFEGGQIQATMAGGIERETAIRVEQNHAVTDQLAAFGIALNDVRSDVRELRSYVMVKREFPGK